MLDRDRVSHVVDTTSRKAEDVSNKLWFLDLKFTQFATPRLIGFVFFLWLILLAVAFLSSVGYAIIKMPVWLAALSVTANSVTVFILAILARVVLESFLVVFRIAESLTNLQYLKEIASNDIPKSAPLNLNASNEIAVGPAT
ncbi:MAG TPA: DUF4282 domain-containing protein [Lacipirellulaceae bacterium]|jgi:hypothetical protein|nr:DUF4282 domain-containing protein [Lacipirellulaceae bacterium]